MDPRSQVLLRNIELFTGKLVLAGLPADQLLDQLPDAQGWSWHAGEYAELTQRFAERCVYSTQLPSVEYSAAVRSHPAHSVFHHCPGHHGDLCNRCLYGARCRI